MGRPTTQKRRCVLGRETGIQQAEWREDGWLWVKNGPVPSKAVDLPAARDEAKYWEPKRYSFDKPELHIDFQWLRTPETDRIFSLIDKPGVLRLYGRESIASWFEQALVGRRQQHFNFTAETELDFSPQDERQMAGIALYYGRYNFHYLAVTAHSDGQREILNMSSLISFPDGRLSFPASRFRSPMRARFGCGWRSKTPDCNSIYALGPAGNFQPVGPELDASHRFR